MPCASGSPADASTSSRETTTRTGPSRRSLAPSPWSRRSACSRSTGRRSSCAITPWPTGRVWAMDRGTSTDTSTAAAARTTSSTASRAFALRRRLRCQRALPGEPRRAEGMVRRSRRAVRPGKMALWVNETGDRQVERELAAYKRKEQS